MAISEQGDRRYAQIKNAAVAVAAELKATKGIKLNRVDIAWKIDQELETKNESKLGGNEQQEAQLFSDNASLELILIRIFLGTIPVETTQSQA